MEGLFYYHDIDELTFLRFYPDGRVVRYGRYNRHNRIFNTYHWFTLAEEQTHLARGIYQLDNGNGIRMVFKSDFGTMVYRGTILDENTIELSYGCPLTNFRKSASFFRFSLEQHQVQLEASEIYTN